MIFTFCYLLILVCVITLTKSGRRNLCLARIGINGFNAIPIIAIIGYYEAKQMKKNGWDYFKNAWNWIDIIFFLSFFLASSFDAASCFKANDFLLVGGDRALKVGGKGKSMNVVHDDDN